MEYKDIKQLLDDMGNSKLQEVNIEFPDGLKINMKKTEELKTQTSIQTPQNIVMTNVGVDNEKVIVANENNDTTSKEENYKEIKAPMVGTFYSKAGPDEKPFVKVGDKIKKGDVVCILEAMKLMNEIESEFDGEVVEICKKDDDMCEYGTTLIKLKTDNK